MLKRTEKANPIIFAETQSLALERSGAICSAGNLADVDSSGRSVPDRRREVSFDTYSQSLLSACQQHLRRYEPLLLVISVVGAGS